MIDVRSVAILWVAIFAIIITLAFWVVVPLARRFRRWHNRPRRTGECCQCGAKVTGRKWWTLARHEAEPDGQGGSIMSADYCREHRPTDVPDGCVLTRH